MTLDSASLQIQQGNGLQVSKLAEMMGLNGQCAMEWKNFLKGLNGNGIKLTEDEDVLAWSWNIAYG